jgi:PAS domain S-box-containing protein
MKQNIEKGQGFMPKLPQVLDSLIEGIQIFDFDWRYIYVNDAVVQHGKTTKEDLLDYTLMEKYPQIVHTPLFEELQYCMKERISKSIENEFLFEDNSKRWFELKIQPVTEGLFIISTDITARKEAEAKLNKINHLYSFLSQINQNILRVKDEDTLFLNACRMACEFGKFKMAWIGLFQENYAIINLAEQFGMPQETIPLFKNGICQANGPQDYVVRNQTFFVCNDIEHETEVNIQRWLPFARTHDIKACLLLPIWKSGEIIGTLNLYSSQSSILGEEEINLLVQAANDISFALDKFEQTRQKEEAERQVLLVEKRFRALIEKSSDMITLSGEAGNMLYVSPSALKIFGYTETECLSLVYSSFIHPDYIAEFALKRKGILGKPSASFSMELPLQHKNGMWIWCETTITNMLEEPSIQALLANFRDISEQKLTAQQKDFDNNNLFALINNTQDFMWSADKEYNIITCNQAFRDRMKAVTGKTITQGDNILQFGLAPIKLARYKMFLDRAFAGETFTEKYENVPFSEHWGETSMNPIRKEGEIVGAACYTREITQQIAFEQKLKASELFSRGILDSLSSYITVIDHLGNIVAINEPWENFARENGETNKAKIGIGQNYYKVCEESILLGDTMAAEVLAGIKDVLQDKQKVFYYEYPCHSEDTKRWFAMSVMKFNSGEPLMVISHQDISERKKTELQLEVQNEVLTKTNAELDRFVYSASHELRAPLTSVLGLLYLIENGSKEADTLEYAKMIHTSVNRLDEFIKNILGYSKNNRTDLNIEQIDVKQSVTEIIDALRNMQESEDIHFELDITENVPFYSDKLRFNSIMENFISNAIKYQKKGNVNKWIKIDANTEKDKLNICVADNGIGIAPAHHHKIFDMFVRLSGKVPGSGIGLYIVKEMTEKLHGSIQLNSEEGIGSAFQVNLKNWACDYK